MNEHTGTVTDPVWWYIAVAGLIVLGAITLYTILDSVLRLLIRQAQQRRELSRWNADVRANAEGWR